MSAARPEDVRPVQVQEVDIFERQRVKEDGDDDRLEKVARRPGRRDEHEVATRVSQPSDIDGNRLRPADDRKVAERSHERQDHRANQIDVDEGIERDPAEILRRRIAETIGGPRVSRFVNRQREQHDNERDDGGDEVGRLIHKARKFSRSVKRKAKLPAYQGFVGGFVGDLSGVVAKCERTASAALAPTTRTSSSRVARRTPARLPKAVSNALRRLGPTAGDHIQIGSQVALRPRLPVKRDGEPMRLVANPLQEEQRRALARERDRVVTVAHEEQLLLLGNAHRDQAPEPELLERRVRGRQLPFAAVDQQEIREWTTGLEDSTVASQDDFVHRGEVVIGLLAGSAFGVAARLGTRSRRPQALPIQCLRSIADASATAR